MNKEEFEDVKARILKLNKNTFDPSKFVFDHLFSFDYLKTILILRLYDFNLTEHKWKNTDKYYVLRFKVNQRGSVSRADASLFWFFRLELGVL